MTMTIEIPGDLARRLRAAATAMGIPVEKYVSEVLEARLPVELVPSSTGAVDGETEKPWMKFFGIASDLRQELAEIDRIIEEEFETIEPEDWE